MSDFNERSKTSSRPYRVSTQGDQQVGPHFAVREFACSDGTDVLLLHPALVQLLEAIRAEWGRPVTVTSGFRTGAHNSKIGGADNSRHLYGLAADIVIPNVAPDTVADVADDLGAGGVGRYEDFTHVDVWGSRRRWDRRTNPKTDR